MSGHIATLAELIELRQPAQSLALFTQQQVKTDRIGPNTSAFRGRGMDFEEVRMYQPGDDIRTMDWRVTARTGKPHTKVYREERERPVYLMVDFGPSMFFGTKVMFKSVLAAKIAAMIAWSAIQNHDRVGGVLFSTESELQLRPRSRSAGVLPLIKAIADFTQHEPQAQMNHDAMMEKSCTHLRRVVKPGSMVIIISDFQNLSEESQRHLSRLSHTAQLLSIMVCDPLEISPPPPDIYSVSDGQNYLTLNTQEQQFCHQYRQLFAIKNTQVKQYCHQHGINFMTIATDDDILKKLKRLQ